MRRDFSGLSLTGSVMDDTKVWGYLSTLTSFDVSYGEG